MRTIVYRSNLQAALMEAVLPIEGGPLDGTLMLSAERIREVIAETPIPDVDETTAELTTPATVYLTAECHICGEHGEIVVNLESKTTVDNKHRTLAAKVDAGSINHICGQTTLARASDAVPGQTEADWTVPVEDISDIPDGHDADPDPCPHPGCVREAEHRGRHRLAEPEPEEIGTDESPDAVLPDDTDLLPD